MVYWDAGRNFRLSAYRLDPNREYQPKPTSGDSAALAQESFESGGFRYDATVTREADKDFWMLQGTISGPGRLAVVTITWEESRWQEWALHTFRDVRPPKAEAERRSLPQ